MAKASDASESMIRFTHSICTVVRGDSVEAMAPPAAVTSATRLTVSWNWRNLLMLE